MTAAVGARNLFKVDAGVVHALLQARYYDGSKGEFLSEDPVFLGDPRQQNLNNPQSLNSYSYANDNPITKSDPTGRCAGPLLVACVAIIGAGIASYTTYAGDILNNRASPQPGVNPYLDNLSSPGAYALGDITGGFSLAFLQEYRTANAGLSFVSSLKQDEINGKKPDYGKALIDGGITLVTGVSFDAAIGKTAAKTTTGRIAGEIVSDFMPLTRQAYSATQAFSYRAPGAAWIGGNASGIPNNSGLPGVIKQNGTTYVRNSSGLLNIAK